MNRIEWIDRAKGIGILLVVYGHVTRGLEQSDIMANSPFFHLVDRSIYSFHMPLFFFLSGIFFIQSYSKYGINLFINKLSTIVYPYIVWSVLQIFLKAAAAGHTNSTTELGSILSLAVAPVEQFWFLYTLFIITVSHIFLFAIALRLMPAKQHAAFIVFAAATALFWLRPFFPGYFALQSSASYMIFFSLGLLASKHASFFSNMKSVLALPFCFLLLCYTIFYLQIWPADSALLQLFLAVMGIGSVLVILPASPGRVANSLTFLGSYSLEIYCIHVITASGARIILQQVFHINALSLHLTVGIISGLLLPIVITALLKKVPFLNLFSLPWLSRNRQ